MSILSQPIQDILLRGNQRTIANIRVNTTISENTNDTLTITKQPVQQGASIVDHAYKEPTTLSMSILLSDNLNLTSFLPDLSKIYTQMLNLQSSRVPFDIITPKRVYKNMLMATLSVTTDKATENILSINASFQEVIIVNISTTTVPRTSQALSAATEGTQKTGRISALLTGFQAFVPGAKGFSAQ